MMRSTTARWFFAATILLAAVPACRKSEPDTKPVAPLTGHNVLLVTLDTTRADRLGSYGYADAATAALDGLAARGTQFDSAFAQVPITLPSHCTILTGRYPKEFGVRDNGRTALPERFDTLAEIFARNGYRTGAVVASFVLDARFGLSQGFERYRDDMQNVNLETPAFQWQLRADEVTDRAIAWLETAKSDPFFAWVHYYDPHDPYAPPSPFDTAHPDPYDGEIAFMDAHLGRLLDWLKNNKLDERTLIAVVGDHGESLGEHGVHGHTMFVYDNIIRVPMIFAHPAAIPAGRRVTEIVETADVFPTIVELMGWPMPEDVRADSLVPSFRGASLPSGFGYGESDYAFNAYGWSQQRCWVEGRWKYIASAEPALYDLEADPGETNNLAARKPDVAARLHKSLKTFYESLPDGQGDPIELDAEAAKGIQALGYAGDGTTTFVDEFLTPGLPEPTRMLPSMHTFQQAQALMAENRFAEAAPLWESVIAANPRSEGALAFLGACMVHLDRFEEADTYIRRALEINPSHHVALRTLGDLLARTEQFEDAIAAYRAAAAAPVPNPQVFTKLGDLLVRTGKPEEALALYRGWIEKYPDFPALHARLGALLSAAGQLDAAIGHLEKARSLHPDDRWARDQLALAIYRKGLEAAEGEDHAAAAKHFERILELQPGNQDVVEKLINYHLGRRDAASAVRVLRIAAPAATDRRTPILLANILATSRHDEIRDGVEAIRWAKRAIELSGDSRPGDLAVLAATYAEAGRFAEAVETAGEALAGAEEAGNAELTAVLRRQIEGYRNEQPYRHPQF